MIQSVIDTINANISTITKKFGIVEQCHKEDKIYPAEYTGGGDYKEINFDMFESLLYHRLGIQTSTEEESRTACSTDLIITQPCFMVVYLDKSVFNSLKLSSNLRKEITFSNDVTLANELKVDYVSVGVDSINFDPYQVWANEFTGVDYRLQSTHLLLGINYTIEIRGEKNCIIEYECE